MPVALHAEHTFPTELTARNQWVVWKYEQGDGKPTKVPYTPGTNNRADVTLPTAWRDYETALVSKPSKAGGIGFVFVAGDPFVGIDLDKCRNPSTGTIDPWAQAIVDRLQGYTEISPSGNGVHIIVRARPVEGPSRLLGRVEIYESKRFFTMTGQYIDAGGLVEDRTNALRDLYRGLVDAKRFLEWAKQHHATEKIRAVWEGDTSHYDGDDSRADAGLCNYIALYANNDHARIDRVFRLSRLYRPKWDEPRGDGTYGTVTIRSVAYHPNDVDSPLVIVRRRWRDIIAHPKADPEMLVDGLFLADHINMIAGYAYAGKSTAALDVAVSVAAGLPVFSKYTVKTPRPGSLSIRRARRSRVGSPAAKHRRLPWHQAYLRPPD